MISFMACKNEIEIILIKYIHSMESIFYGITLEQNEINFCQQNLIYNKKKSNGFEQIVSAIKIQTQQTKWYNLISVGVQGRFISGLGSFDTDICSFWEV